MEPDALHFLPLGGTGEIGMNLNLYHHRGRWLMVDCGVMFGRDGPHDQHALLPDVSFIRAQRDKLDGLVITHAHQDHLGAVADLWPELRCTVYATPFAAAMLREPLREAGLGDEVPIKIVGESARFSVGPFQLQRIPLTHSTVEMGALVIRSAAGAVLHTGDWKLDPEPGAGRHTDTSALKALARERLLAVVSDSTNADHEGWTPSEATVASGIEAALAGVEQRAAVTLFSSNIARVAAVAAAAERLGRSVVTMGRSLDRTLRAAQQVGYLADLPPFVSTRDFGYLPRDRVLVLCTGSQGEPRAALSKLASGVRRDVYLEQGDTVLFSARQIPGNELFVERLSAMLEAKGIARIHAQDAPIHCSGHPRRDELRELYRWVRPRTVVPVHGTPPKLAAHAELAEAMGLGAARIRNGDLLRLGPGPATVVDRVRTGRVRRVEVDRRPGLSDRRLLWRRGS